MRAEGVCSSLGHPFPTRCSVAAAGVYALTPRAVGFPVRSPPLRRGTFKFIERQGRGRTFIIYPNCCSKNLQWALGGVDKHEPIHKDFVWIKNVGLYGGISCFVRVYNFIMSSLSFLIMTLTSCLTNVSIRF